MAKKILPTDNNSRMAAQIDEIYNRLSFVDDLLTDLAPALEKISKETHETVKELREKFERDETLTLLKKVGDNIPTFVELLNVMEAVKGLMTDAAPAIGKITKETHETVKELREKFERDETLTLLKKVGDNIPTFVELLNVMEAVKGLMIDVSPAIGKISKEVTPTINMLRESFEKDEALQLLQKTGENINTFNKLLDFLGSFDRSGTLDFTLVNASTKEIEYMLKGMLRCLSKAMQEIAAKPPQPGIRNLLSAIRNTEVQKGILLMTIFARYLPQSVYETIQEGAIQQK